MGNRIFINTGRSRSWIPTEVLSSGIDFDGFLCGFSYIETNGRILKNDLVKKQTAERAISFSLERGVPLLLEGVNTCFSLLGKISASNIEITEKTDEFILSDDINKLTKILFIKKMTDEDISLFPEFDFICYNNYSEAFLKGHTKAGLIRDTEALLGLDHEKTIAFGDSPNDISMLDYAKTGVLIYHGDPDMSDFHTDITTTGDPETAVARTLDFLF